MGEMGQNIAVMVVHESGNLLFSYNTDNRFCVDVDLMGGFFTAVFWFADSLYANGNRVRKIVCDRNEMVVVHSDSHKISFVFDAPVGAFDECLDYEEMMWVVEAFERMFTPEKVEAYRCTPNKFYTFENVVKKWGVLFARQRPTAAPRDVIADGFKGLL